MNGEYRCSKCLASIGEDAPKCHYCGATYSRFAWFGVKWLMPFAGVFLA